MARLMLSRVDTKRLQGYIVTSFSVACFLPVVVSKLYMLSISLSKNIILKPWFPNSPNDAIISMLSPLTRNVVGFNSISVRVYSASTSLRNNSLR